MAAFADQFKRRDPLVFNAHGVLNMWPRQLAWEARRLVVGRSSSELAQIARAVDRVVDRQAVRTIVRGPRAILESRRFPPKSAGLMTPRKYSSEAVAQVRRDDGDLNLYVEAGGIAALRIDTVGQALGIKPWEAFAAITLWKLVDLYEGLASAPDRDVDGRLVVMPRRGHQEIGLLRRSRQALHDATADAIEAAAACTLASEAFQREQLMSVVFAENQQLAAKIYALESVESERQQTRAASRQASKARWSALEDHKQRALKLANSQPFKHRSTAARFAMERIEKGGDGQTYTFETVGGWLKRFGWTAEC